MLQKNHAVSIDLGKLCCFENLEGEDPKQDTAAYIWMYNRHLVLYTPASETVPVLLKKLTLDYLELFYSVSAGYAHQRS